MSKTKTKFAAIILAAGKGTRMKTDLPKVLHPICGRPLIDFPLIAANAAGANKKVIVVGHGADKVKSAFSTDDISFVLQAKQLGTGHAVLLCEEALSGYSGNIVILCGDAPLIKPETLETLVESHASEKNSVTVLTADVDDPTGYGRIVKEGRSLLRIVEEKDTSKDEKKIVEINSGVYCVEADFLFSALKKVGKENAQGEYYLTDIITIAKDSGKKAGWAKAGESCEVLGINSRVELAYAGKFMTERINQSLMEEGVTFVDPGCTYVDTGVEVGRDTVLWPQVRLEGTTKIGSGVTIESGSVIRNSLIDDGTHVRPYCVIDDSKLESGTTIGPFAHLRPRSVIRKGAKIGNFVETKKATIGEGSKVNHLSYVGDAELGPAVNVGAGTVTCNYDGYNKFKTTIEEGAFIGSGTNLVAPVTIGKKAIIGAGSTITKDVPSDALSLTRPEQRVHEGWAKKKHREKEKE